MSLGRDVAAIGSYRAPEGAIAPGAVFIIRRVGGAWELGERLVLPGGEHNDRFGAGVVLSDAGTLYAGASRRGGVGALGVFDVIGGVFAFREIVTPGALAPDASFGWGLARRGRFVLVGAHCEANTANGEARLFTDDGTRMREVARYPSQVAVGDEWGQAVALADELVLVGAFHADTDAGALYALDAQR